MNDVEDTIEYAILKEIAFVFYDFEMQQDEMLEGEHKNSSSNSLRRATNLRSVCGSRGHVIAISLVWSARIHI